MAIQKTLFDGVTDAKAVVTKKPTTAIGRDGTVYHQKEFKVQTNWHKAPFTVKAFGFPHARNIVNKMLGRINTATSGIKIEEVKQKETVAEYAA